MLLRLRSGWRVLDTDTPPFQVRRQARSCSAYSLSTHATDVEGIPYAEFTKSIDSDHISGVACMTVLIIIAPQSPIEVLLSAEASKLQAIEVS